MRHRKSVIKLGRTAAHRKATLANLSAALFERKHIKTTETKAKATRSFSEKLITLAKKGSLHARRYALKQLRHKRIVKILFDEIAPQYADRPGGYTRVIKIGQRQGDGAHMAVVELVGFETASKKKREKEKAKEAETKKKKKVKAEEAEEEKGQPEVKEEKGKKKATKSKLDVEEAKEKTSAKVKKKEDKDKGKSKKKK